MNTRPHSDYQVFLGLDVGKENHHATALSPQGKRLHDRALPQDEARLRALFEKLAALEKQTRQVSSQLPSTKLPANVPAGLGPRLDLQSPRCKCHDMQKCRRLESHERPDPGPLQEAQPA